VNTIERPFLEFSAPRSIFRTTDALNLARIQLDPYNPEIAAAISEIEGVGEAER
jgi:hypothetical protein